MFIIIITGIMALLLLLLLLNNVTKLPNPQFGKKYGKSC